ncbi:MAG: cupin domain-containing protein [Alphaproteobacteria bacterium]
MPKLDLESIELTNRTTYPMPFAAEMSRRSYRRLGPAGGLTDIGISQVVLEPGGVSSQRHWHKGIDEFVVVLEGEAVLIEDEGETLMRAGDCAAFPKDRPNGHQLVNRGDRPCVFLAIDSRLSEGDCHYPDVDLHWDNSAQRYTRKDGTPY